MNSTYSIVEAQSKLSQLIHDAQQSQPIAITKHQKTVAYLISKEKMQMIAETLEILANPKATKAIRGYEKGKIKFLPLTALNEN